ncbi:MAG: hypothetical protein JO353_01895, partial [Phycisphaerae bacterium]|nr:hypothetical protein [Phycisphaerae bacterium]
RVALDWTLDLFFTKDIVQFITLRQIEQLRRPAAMDPTPHAPPHGPS